MKKIATISCLIAVLMTSSLDCGKTEDSIIFPTTLSDLSLVQIWDKVLEITGVQDNTLDLQQFSLYTTNADTLELLVIEFYGTNTRGKTKLYQAEVGSKGILCLYSDDSDMAVSANPPLPYFEELDKKSLSSIAPGGFFLTIEISFNRGNFSYSHDRANISHLKGGDLKPLKDITFDTNIPFGTILVTDSLMMQRWFITNDINKATTVEYLETQ